MILTPGNVRPTSRIAIPMSLTIASSDCLMISRCASSSIVGLVVLVVCVHYGVLPVGGGIYPQVMGWASMCGLAY